MAHNKLSQHNESHQNCQYHHCQSYYHDQMGKIVLLAMAMVTTVTSLKGSLFSPMYQQQGPSIFNSVTLLFV